MNEEYKIGGNIVLSFDYGKSFSDYYICGISTMIYDEDCEGEPEWKHTKEVQEIAVVRPFDMERVFEKPCWIRIKDLPKYQNLLSTIKQEER